MSYANTHHSFSTELAQKYGIEHAIIIHHFQHWIKINRRLKKNLIEGRTWTYQSRKDIAAHFSYLTEDRVRRITDDLCEMGVLIKKNFNKSKLVKTNWYAFKDESIFIEDSKNVSDLADLPNGLADLPNGDGNFAKCNKDIDSLERCLKEEKKDDSASASRMYGKFVKLKDEEYDAFLEQFGREELDSTIQAINDYLASTGKKPYKDYSATIRNWVKKKNPAANIYTAQEKSNRWFIQEATLSHPVAFKNCVIRGKFVINTATNEELLLDINHETFKSALVKMFGKKKNVPEM